MPARNTRRLEDQNGNYFWILKLRHKWIGKIARTKSHLKLMSSFPSFMSNQVSMSFPSIPMAWKKFNVHFKHGFIDLNPTLNICQLEWCLMEDRPTLELSKSRLSNMFGRTFFFWVAVSPSLSPALSVCHKYLCGLFLFHSFSSFYILTKWTHMMKELIDLWWSTVINVLCAIRRFYPFILLFPIPNSIWCWCFEV